MSAWTRLCRRTASLCATPVSAPLRVLAQPGPPRTLGTRQDCHWHWACDAGPLPSHPLGSTTHADCPGRTAGVPDRCRPHPSARPQSHGLPAGLQRAARGWSTHWHLCRHRGRRAPLAYQRNHPQQPYCVTASRTAAGLVRGARGVTERVGRRAAPSPRQRPSGSRRQRPVVACWDARGLKMGRCAQARSGLSTGRYHCHWHQSPEMCR